MATDLHEHVMDGPKKLFVGSGVSWELGRQALAHAKLRRLPIMSKAMTAVAETQMPTCIEV